MISVYLRHRRSIFKWAVADLSAPSDLALDISGWQPSDLDGHNYTIPDALPPVPRGGFVLIHFDGLGAGADDYDFSDGVAVLHTPPDLVDIFDDQADQVALYTGTIHNHKTIRDFVAYGGPPGGDADHAVAAGLWPPDGYTGPTTQVPGGEVLTVGGSVGIYPGKITHAPAGWAIYASAQTTPGGTNPAPAPYFRNPPDGIATSDHQIPFGWSNVAEAVSYRLEVDDDPAFGSPILAVEVPESHYTPEAVLPDGTFYYRVKARLADGSESGWSATSRVTFISVVAASPAIASSAGRSTAPPPPPAGASPPSLRSEAGLTLAAPSSSSRTATATAW